MISWRQEVVALGRAYIGNGPHQIHSKSLLTGYYKVSVDVIEKPYVELPYPDGFHSTCTCISLLCPHQNLRSLHLPPSQTFRHMKNLINRVGVYGGSRVLFDSLETPGKSIVCAAENDNSEVIDISFARGSS